METQSDKIFSSQVPDEWIYRKIEPDYGLDREIEIVIDGKLTGKTLLVQLKSSLSMDISGRVIRFSLETDKLSYYMERDVPILLVLTDLKTKKCWFLFIQEHVCEKLDVANPLWRQQKTVVLEIPTASVWASSIDAIREIALSGPIYLTMKKLASLNTDTTLRWKANADRIDVLEKFAKSLDMKAAQIDLDLAIRYSVEGQEEESYKKLLSAYESRGDPATRIKSIEAFACYFNPTDKAENRKLFELSVEGAELAQKMGNKLHFLYLHGVALEAVFFRVVNNLKDQILLQKVSHESKSDFEAFVSLSILETSQKLEKIVLDFVSNMGTSEQEQYYVVFTDLLRRHALMMLYLYQSLVVWVDASQISDLLKSAESDLNVALKIGEYMKWNDMRCMILNDMAMLYFFRNDRDSLGSALKQLHEIAQKTGHRGVIIQAQKKAEFYEKAGRFITGPKDIPKSKSFDELTDEEIDRMHRYLLEAGGIDTNRNDELARLARLGLRDRNPERVLRHCENLHVEIITYGPIWDMVGLNTTGSKLLYCQLKYCFLYGRSLDEQMREFKKQHCSKCDSHSPRPADWKWSYRWQREREVPDRMKLILKNLRRVGA